MSELHLKSSELHPKSNWVDVETFNRAGTITILAVALVHLYEAGVLLSGPQAMTATSITAFRIVLKAFDLPHNHFTIAATLLVTALLASIGTICRISHARIFTFLPQHAILGVMAGGGVWAMVVGHYLDGVVVPWQHISVDQAPLFALFISHSAAILRRCWDPT
jgi:hypothetical protein